MRGFAKWASAAADTRPGLIPQKSTRRPGARTSGIGDSGCFGLGELVRVTSAHGTVVGRARVNPRTGPGSVSLTHGRADLHASRLTSAVVEVDPLTGMPLMSGVAVSVERSPA